MPPISQQQILTCPSCGHQFPAKPLKVTSDKLILTEGLDGENFLRYACQAYNIRGVQIMNYRGIPQLRPFLEALVGGTVPGFSNVKALIIARDADDDVSAAIQSMRNTFRDYKFPEPSEPFQYVSNKHYRVAFILYPGPGQNNQCEPGRLEDLCLKTINDNKLIKCVDTFLKCVKTNQKGDEELKHLWKSKLYAYLAGKDDHAGKKLGEAARDSVWNFNHPIMKPFKLIIKQM